MGNGIRNGSRWWSTGGLAALALAAIVGLATLAAGGCHGGPPRDGAGAEPRGQEGSSLPEFQLTALDGTKLSRESLRGRVVIVDFWDTWCGPCLRALPHLKAVGTSHPDIVVVGVALGQEGEAKVRQVVTSQELPFPVCLLSAQGDLAPVFGDIDALPTTFLIGRDGVIRRRWVGAQSPVTYENAVKELLGS